MIKDLIRLMRVKQWYKNFLIFLPLVFGQQLFNNAAFSATVLGFLSLCMISSSNYVINDIIDRKKDKKNPEKKNRPLAADRIKVWHAVLFSLILFILGIYIAINLSMMFFVFVMGLFIMTQLYSFWLKNEPFADILAISVNFVIRTVSGNFVIANGTSPYMNISSWLILCPFFLALFLAVSKRQSELLFLKGQSAPHRSTLKYYNKKITYSLIIISTTLLIVSYSLYVFFSPYSNLIFTLPFVLFIIFHFFYYAEKGKKIARNVELVYKNKKILITILIVLLIAFVAIYGPSSFSGLIESVF